MKTLEQLRNRYMGKKIAMVNTLNYNNQIGSFDIGKCLGVSDKEFKMRYIQDTLTRSYEWTMLTEEVVRNYFNTTENKNQKQFTFETPLQNNEIYAIKTRKDIETQRVHRIEVVIMEIIEDEFTGAKTIREKYNGTSSGGAVAYTPSITKFTMFCCDVALYDTKEEVIQRFMEILSNETEFMFDSQVEQYQVEKDFLAFDFEYQYEILNDYFVSQNKANIYVDFDYMTQDNTPSQIYKMTNHEDFWLSDDNVYSYEDSNTILAWAKECFVENMLYEDLFIQYLMSNIEELKTNYKKENE